MKKIKIIHFSLLVLFLPVLFCVMFIGNKMDYFDGVKADILVPNALLTLIALAALGLCLWVLYLGRNVRLTKRTNRYLDCGLVVSFVLFFFFCMWLSKETVFDMAVDPGGVREVAKEIAQGVSFGYRFELSMNYNNLPITYLLGRLYRLAEGWTWYGHDPEYLWVTIGCALVSAAGFCCCEIVKILTKNPVAVLGTFLLYLVTAGISPWKYIPYTDSYGILFPVLCFLLFLCAQNCKKAIGKILWLFFALFAGVVGGFIKPSAYIAVLAVVGFEAIQFTEALIRWIRSRKAGAEEKKHSANRVGLVGGAFLLSLVFVFLLYNGTQLVKKYIIEDMDLIYNEEIEATMQYFFFMGTNEETTGSFTVEDYGVFGEFQFSKAERNAACMERAWERIRQRGPLGTVYFCLKKLVKSFNDGTFAWTDVRYYEPFPEILTHDGVIPGYLRSLFMPEGPNQGKYDTLAELVWIFILMGVPGIILAKKEEGIYRLFSIELIGIMLYLMLFESGARYLFIFLPVFIVVSVCGMVFIESAIRERGLLTRLKKG